jgi:hypothetical protein
MSNVPDFTTGEPAPIPNATQGMHDLVVEDMSGAIARSTSIPQEEYPALAGTMTEFEDRKMFGFNKYGTLLQAGNGRNATRDALDEALDLTVYMRQMVTEGVNTYGANLDAMYRNAIEFCIALKHILIKSETDNDADGDKRETGSPDLAGGLGGVVPEVPGETAS